jgi:Holliday junction DNA helicase RuvA
MIATLRGKLIHKAPTSVILETGGIGFQALIPVSSFNKLGEIGDEVQLLTYLHVREDALQLFGFISSEERQLFLSLISITGIGPKLAQGILSGITVGDFKSAILHQDITALTRIPGIGKKTAERLVLELRDKTASWGEGGQMPEGKPSTHEEAILALISLGYKRNSVENVIQKLFKQDSTLGIEEVIRRALREL